MEQGCARQHYHRYFLGRTASEPPLRALQFASLLGLFDRFQLPSTIMPMNEVQAFAWLAPTTTCALTPPK